MKKLFQFPILLSMLLFAACDENTLMPSFEIDKASVAIGAEGGIEYLQVTSATEWVAVSDKPWISISPANGIGSTKCRRGCSRTERRQAGRGTGGADRAWLWPCRGDRGTSQAGYDLALG